MDPATILILLGAFYAIKSGIKGVRLASAAASRASVPSSTRGSGKKAGGGMPAWFDHRRHTGTGWWAGEIGHGFPVFRAGMREGWTRHQTAMGQRQAAVAKTQADHTARQNTYKAERAAHRKRLADIERQERERQEAERQAAAAAAAAAAPAPAPTPAGGPGWRAAPPAGSNGGTAHGGYSGSPPVMAPPPQPGCTDPGCTCHSTGRGSQPAAPAGSAPTNGQASAQPSASPSGGTVSDTSYEMTQETCDKIAAALEAAMNDEQLTAAEQLCDGLGADLVDDTETLGHAGDLVTAIKEARAAMARAADQAEALKASHEKNHGAAHEAALATGHMAEREHHVNA